MNMAGSVSNGHHALSQPSRRTRAAISAVRLGYAAAAMQTPWLSWLPWLLVAAGAALGAPYLLRVLRASLNAEAFTAVVRKLLDARNADRAVKLTRAASDSPLASATRAAILACGQGVAQTDASADYRSAGDLSPERVLAPVRARYDEAFEAQAAPVRYARYAAIPGALMLVAALSLAGGRPPPDMPQVVAAAMGLAMIAWSGRSERGLMASREANFTALRDAFDALIRDPRRTTGGAGVTRVGVSPEGS